MDISVIKVLDRMDIAHERIVLLANEDCNLCPYTQPVFITIEQPKLIRNIRV